MNEIIGADRNKARLAPICRGCERVSGCAGAFDPPEPGLPAECAVCGAEARRYVDVGPLGPDPAVLARAFNVYLDRLQSAHDSAARGLAEMAARARGQRPAVSERIQVVDFIPVVVESPFRGSVDPDLAHASTDAQTHEYTRNARYLERCLRDCIERGESPYASHKMLTH